MYFSAEHLALANQALRETFQQCSIAWQAIPHWDTGDPGQISVDKGLLGASAGVLPLVPQQAPFQLTVAEAIAPSPDPLLTGVMAATETLAQIVDKDVLQKCFAGASINTSFPSTSAQDLQTSLIGARVNVENAGYRAPSCLVTNTTGLIDLNQLANNYYNVCRQTLTAANINSLYRFDPLDGSATNATNTSKARMVCIGRRRRIAQGAAPEASPGEEPVDLAVSLMPSLEVDGEVITAGVSTIQLTVRIRYATRITDATGLVALKE
jgi:hypothetical protein